MEILRKVIAFLVTLTVAFGSFSLASVVFAASEPIAINIASAVVPTITGDPAESFSAPASVITDGISEFDGDCNGTNTWYASNTGNNNNTACDVNVILDLGTTKTFNNYLYMSGPKWVQDAIDLKSSGYLDDESYTAKDWTVQVSDNGTDWTMADTVTGNLNARTVRILPNKVAGRYIKFHITKKSEIIPGSSFVNHPENFWPLLKIVEIQIYEDSAISNPPTTAPNGQINDLVRGLTPAFTNTTPGNDGASPPLSVLTDGNINWSDTGTNQFFCASSGKEGNTSIYVTLAWDLGKVCTIQKYTVWSNTDIIKNITESVFDKAYSVKNFTFDVSDDRKNWKTVDTVTGNTLVKLERTLAMPVTTRYIRFHITKSADKVDGFTGDFWPAIRLSDLQVYGAPGTSLPQVSSVQNSSSISNNVSNNSSPNTGDNLPYIIFITIVIFSAAFIILLYSRNKKCN